MYTILSCAAQFISDLKHGKSDDIKRPELTRSKSVNNNYKKNSLDSVS